LNVSVGILFIVIRYQQVGLEVLMAAVSMKMAVIRADRPDDGGSKDL
jgi:hypothetical protein